MKRYSLFFVFFSICLASYCQSDGPSSRRGIVKVQKTGLLAYIKFDAVNYRLIGIDRYGNISDTAVIQFSVRTNIRGIGYQETITGSNLSVHLQQLLARRESRTTLYFTAVRAKDQKGTLINMPDFKFTFPYTDREYY